MARLKYEIEPMPLDFGGGYRLRLFEGGEEVETRAFPLAAHPESEREEAGKKAFADAQDDAVRWILCRYQARGD